MFWQIFIQYVPAGCVGALLASLIWWIQHRLRRKSYKRLAAEIVTRAEKEYKARKEETELNLKALELQKQQEMDQLWATERRKMAREEDRLNHREDKLERRILESERRFSDLERREQTLTQKEALLKEEQVQTAVLAERLSQELEKASSLTREEAKAALLKKTESEIQREMAALTRRLLQERHEQEEVEACRIITTAINRLCVPTVSETTVTTVPIPGDDMKGRIIGREGRNIRALEAATGVNFIIDETPGAVVLSSFDPVRKHVAKLALQELVMDGRIHPTRIDEVVDHARKKVEKEIWQYGQDATLRAGVHDLHPELIRLLGKLKFRYSFGQNILEHSLEVSHLLGIMATELGLNARLARRIGLLHDMGKAVSHEVEGTHALIGHDLALRYGESEEVANGIGCHHGEISPMTMEGSLCEAADSISASRPGARIEAVEEYVKRLRRLEKVASEYPGVESAYALQAGREVRVMVMPDVIDDDGVINLARDLTRRIERELSYPGKIKVTIIREKKAVEYAM